MGQIVLSCSFLTLLEGALDVERDKVETIQCCLQLQLGSLIGLSSTPVFLPPRMWISFYDYLHGYHFIWLCRPFMVTAHSYGPVTQ